MRRFLVVAALVVSVVGLSGARPRPVALRLAVFNAAGERLGLLAGTHIGGGPATIDYYSFLSDRLPGVLAVVSATGWLSPSSLWDAFYFEQPGCSGQRYAKAHIQGQVFSWPPGGLTISYYVAGMNTAVQLTPSSMLSTDNTCMPASPGQQLEWLVPATEVSYEDLAQGLGLSPTAPVFVAPSGN